MFEKQSSAGIGFMRATPSVAGDVRDVPRPVRGSAAKPRVRTRVRVLPSTIREKGIPGFLRWLQRDFPAAYDKLANQRPELLRAAYERARLGQVEMPAVATAGQKIADFVLPLLQVYQQQQILKLQLKRAKLGQPPVDFEAYAVPPARFELEAGAKTQRTALLIAGALGLGAAAYFLTQRRARA